MPQTGPAGPRPHFISYYDLFYHQQYRAASTARGETGASAGAGPAAHGHRIGSRLPGSRDRGASWRMTRLRCGTPMTRR
jgi:hypothetical protein